MGEPSQDPRDVAIARVVIGAAVLGGAWLVLRSPVVRRLAWRGATFAAVTWLPAFVAAQVREAWAGSAQGAPDSPDVTPRPAIPSLQPPAPQQP